MFVPVLIILVIVYGLYWWINSKPKNFPPGLPSIPIVGSLPFLPLQDIHLAMQEWMTKYGPIVSGIFPQGPVVFVTGSDLVYEVLQRDEFQGRPDTDFFRERSFNKRLGVFFSDGPYWVEQRRFTLRHLRDLGFGKSSMDAIVYEEVNELFEEFNKESVLQVSGLFNLPVLNVLWAVMAGCRFSHKDKKLQDILNRLFAFTRSGNIAGNIANVFPILKIIAPKITGYTDSVETTCKLQQMFREVIDEHKATLDPENPRDFIDVYIGEIKQQKENTSTGFTEESLIVIGTDLFAAGAESVSNTLGFCVLYMVLYPEIQKKVQEELDRVVGHSRKPCLADRSQLHYVEAVITEVLRINPIAPMAAPHRTMKDTHLSGYFIPNDTLVLISLWSVLRDKKHWGDPEKFRPERFINSEGKFTKDDYLILFGVGKRTCLGERLARNSLFTFFTCIFQNYSFSLLPNEPKPSTSALPGFTAAPQPFKVCVSCRK